MGSYTFLILLLGIFNPSLIEATSPTEEVRILFICEKPEVLGRSSLQEIKKREEDKVFLENGRLFFFTFAPNMEPAESQEFRFQNGNFLWKRDEFLDPSPEVERRLRNYQFVVEFNPQEYEKWKNHSTRIPNLFWVFREEVPNGYRKLGNTIFLSCPRSPTEIGKLRLVFREGRLIRQSYTRIEMENWFGDL